MGAIGGIHARDGAPIERENLQFLGHALAQLGPDAEHLHQTPPVGMVQRSFYTTAAMQRGGHPIERDGIALTWNGRLDNPDEVRSALGDEARSPSDPDELVLDVYRRWGVQGLGRLVGDFSLALWDGRERRLVLACDGIGLWPLYYHANGKYFFWSSRVRPLLALANLPADPDEHYVASYLTTPRPMSRSPLRGIRTVPAGHAVLVCGDDVRLERFWALDPHREIRYRTDEEYEEHFREVFRQAVACRLESRGPVFSDLSGGLDSSSIVCVGDQLLAAGEAGTTALHTVSYGYEQAKSCDERAYSTIVEEHRGQSGVHILDDEHPLLSPVSEKLTPDHPTVQNVYQRRHEYLADQMEAAGARVFLRGMAGDQVLWGESAAPFEVADHLVRGRILSSLGSCYRWSRALRVPFLKGFWQGGIWPLMPRGFKGRTEFSYPLESWFDKDFIKRVQLHEYLLGLDDDVGFPQPSSRAQYAMIREVSQDIRGEFCLEDRCIEVRYPFLDRRLVEFAMAIPLSQKLRVEETRSILRRSMRGVLPEAIRTRRTKAGPEEAIYRATAREVEWFGELFSEPRVCSRGFVDRQSLRAMLQRIRHGQSVVSQQLLRSITLEIWLRSLEVRPYESDFEVDLRMGRPHQPVPHSSRHPLKECVA